MDTFGEWLREQRSLRRLTREEFAKRVGCSASLLSKLEYGERRPSVQIAELIASCLEIPPSQRPTFIRVARGELRMDRLLPQAAPAENPPAPKVNLPIFPTPLIGREHELEQLGQLLPDPQCRLLTLVGPGGIGKTRLAVETASRTQDSFASGAYFIALAGVHTTSFIIPLIAEALGFTFQGAGQTEPKTQLFSYLRGKQLLLLMDNLEHLLSGPGVEVLSELLANVPQIKLLATSRESLRLQGEWVFEVHGLPIPAGDITQGTSVELFLQRARRASIEFKAAAEDYPAIFRICRLVDGMPLGLELAAAWVRTLSCAEIAEEIERGLDFLNNSARDLPERHRSIRAVFDHSWKLLSEEEQSVLRRLSVFHGGFSLEAAQEIAGATVFTLSNLVAKSLIRRIGKDRYDLHELLRQYAKTRAQADPEEYEATEACHSEYYLNFVRSMEHPLIGPKQVSARAEFAANMENIRPAWDHAIRHHQFEMMRGSINSFWNFFESHTWFHEGLATFGAAADEIERACGPVSHMDAPHLILYEYLRCCQGWCYLHVGKFEEARSMLEEGIATLRSLDARGELSRSLHYLGVIYWQAGEYLRARELFHEKEILDLGGGNPWNLGLAYGNLGMVSETMGLLEESRDYFQKAISTFRSFGDVRLLGIGLFYLGSVMNKMGLIQEGKTHLYESLEISRSIGDRFGTAMASNSLGLALQKEGNPVRAQQMFQESLNVSSEMGERWITQQCWVNLGYSKLALSEADEAQECFLKALRLAREINLTPCMLDSLAGIAWVYAGQGQDEAALELVIQVEMHPAVTQDTKGRAEELRQQLLSQLAPAQIKTVQRRASEKAFEAVVQDLLD
ncbi:MAG TPA: tetratricopeptide repeat protein [Anaerolineales bacterium]